jgi:hypothetical protein
MNARADLDAAPLARGCAGVGNQRYRQARADESRRMEATVISWNPAFWLDAIILEARLKTKPEIVKKRG